MTQPEFKPSTVDAHFLDRLHDIPPRVPRDAYPILDGDEIVMADGRCYEIPECHMEALKLLEHIARKPWADRRLMEITIHRVIERFTATETTTDNNSPPTR